MHLKLSPQMGLPGQPEMTVHVAGDVITIDGTPYDLSAIPEGGEGWPKGDSLFIGPITRQDGELNATVRVVLGDDAADDQPTDWAHWTVPVANGPVTIPAIRKPEPGVTE